MTIEIKKPFALYVFTQDVPTTGEAHWYKFHLAYQREGSDETDEFVWAWCHSDTQGGADEMDDAQDVLMRHLEQELEAFRHHVERELAKTGERLYAVRDSPLLTRGRSP